MADRNPHTKTPAARLTAVELPGRLDRLFALTRLVLSAVEDRHDYDGAMRASMSDVQVSITLLCRLHAEINDAKGIDAIDKESGCDWLRFGALLGLLDAEAWRMVSEIAEQPPEDKLADLEHGLRQLVELAERTLAAVRAIETREVQHA